MRPGIQIEGLWRYRQPRGNYPSFALFGSSRFQQKRGQCRLPPTYLSLHIGPGNVIKMGRIEYMVIESKNESHTFTLRNTHFELAKGVFDVEQHRAEHAEVLEAESNCKVCLCNDEAEEDPLISPCNCKGSCRMIHVNCLKTWINSKVKKEIKGIAQSYNFTKF